MASEIAIETECPSIAVAIHRNLAGDIGNMAGCKLHPRGLDMASELVAQLFQPRTVVLEILFGRQQLVRINFRVEDNLPFEIFCSAQRRKHATKFQSESPTRDA